MRLKVEIGLYPHEDDDYETPRFVKGRKRALAEFRRQFHNLFETIEPRGYTNDSLDYIEAVTQDKMRWLEVHQWIQKGANGTAKDVDLRAGISIGNDGATIAHSRWVELLGGTRPIAKPKYNVACDRCQRLEFEHPPDPFVVSQNVLNKPSREFFGENSGVFIVTARALALFQKFAADEFDQGRVAIAGRAKADGYFWIRPRNVLGGQATWEWLDPCPKCRVPRKRDTRYDQFPDLPKLLKSFGRREWNLALINPWPDIAEDGTILQDVAVSGGLFAALYNSKLNGLCWPEDGPLVSVKPTDEILESKRRFADLFIGTADKILKK